MQPKNLPSPLLSSGPLKSFFAVAAFTAAFTYLTSGVFLSGLALLMGASDTLVSYLSVILNICGVLVLFLSAFLVRFKSRKRLCLALTILSRLLTVLIVAIPAVVPKEFRLLVFVPAVVAAFTLQAQATVVLNQWMLTFMDEKRSGRYISLRQTLTLIITVLLSLAGGYWMDYMGGGYIGFAVLFIIAALMAAIEVLLLLPVPDTSPCESAGPCKLSEIFTLPFKSRNFIGFVLYILLFYLLLYIADSFTMVYLMKYLALPYSIVNGLYLIISLPQVVLLGIWGRISDKKGHGFVLSASIWLFAGETLFMSFATKQSWFIFIPLAFLVASVANAGFVISVFNRRYELMPAENRIVYDNFYTAIIGLGFILGPMLGGLIKSSLESIPLLAASESFSGIRLLYPISTAGILLLQLVQLYKTKKGSERDVRN